MPNPTFRLRRLLPLVAAAFLAMGGSANAGPVHLLTWQGPITPVAAEYLVEGIAAAGADGAAAVIIRLDTPGGLDTSMRDIIKAELGSGVPVIVWVGPAGSRAASAGAVITVAADVAAMAPGTNIGSASPVQMGGAIADSTMAMKVKNDAAAYIASIAARRDRDEETCRLFVTEALNLTAIEAREKGVIDLVVDGLPALVDSLRSRGVIPTDAATEIVEVDPDLRQRMLKVLADPNVAYILMMLGIYGLFFELSNPGSFAPGVLGGICLLLALFAFQALPVSYTGVLLILLGVVLLVLEVKVTSFGVLSVGGVTALVLGSLMLFDSPNPWARISLRVLIPTVAIFAGFFLLCVWLAIRGQRRPVVTGKQALVGETGRVLQDVGGDDSPGKVVVHGEIWNATAAGPQATGARVRVLAVEGRRLVVAAVTANDPDDREPRSS